MINYKDLKWESDFTGPEMGYDDVLVVGVYSWKLDPNFILLVDTELEKVIEIGHDCEAEEKEEFY